jgi:hypothetical protein
MNEITQSERIGSERLSSFCRETQNTTLNQGFGSFSDYFFLDKYV